MSDKVLDRVILSLALAVWNRTFTVSKGCAIRVERMPALVPEMKSICTFEIPCRGHFSTVACSVYVSVDICC